MRRPIQQLIIVSLLTILFSCTKNKTYNVEVSISVESEKAEDVKVSVLNMLNSESSSMAEGRTDSLGKLILKFKTNKPLFADLQVGSNVSTLYIEPGYELNVSFSADKYNTAYFSGHGSGVNNYLANVFVIRNEIEQAGGKNIFELNPDEFLDRLDSLEKSVTNFHQQFIDSVELPRNITDLLLKRNKIRILLMRQALQWNYGVSHNFEIPDKLDISNEILYDSVLLNSNMGEYALLFQTSLNIKSRILLKSVKSFEERSEAQKLLPIVINKEIESGNYSSYIKEFLLAKNVDYWMTLLGINQPLDSLYSEFKRKHYDSPYLHSLESRYLRFLSISPGHKAPQIIGVSATGDTISSTNFIGKIVYIDIWASWCGPCIIEIPFAEKLQDVFKENESIVFLNVSVDQDKQGWRDALSKYKNWKGIHMISDRSIYKDYNIVGIPRYILIDMKGHIVNADASRPSNGQIENEIRKLLIEGI